MNKAMQRPPARAKARANMSQYVLRVAVVATILLGLPSHRACAQNRAVQQQAATAYAKKYALNYPADITPRATHGVMVCITRAGQRLLAAGERGWVIVSDDNGKTWRQIPTDTSVTIRQLAFATAQDGWAVGGMGLVLHTTDGGISWTQQLNGDEANAQALSDANADIKTHGANDVLTANLQNAQQTIAGGPTEPFLSILPLSASEVDVAGAFGMAFSSHDGGKSWSSLADFLPNPNGLHIYSMLEQNNIYYIVGEQGLVMQGPAGRPLNTLNPPFQGTFFGQLLTLHNTWIIYGLQGTILRSTDNGAHWTAAKTSASLGIDAGLVLQDGAIVLGDVAGELLVSHDDGQIFKTVTIGTPVLGLIQAANGNVIIAGPGGAKSISLAKLEAGA